MYKAKEKASVDIMLPMQISIIAFTLLWLFNQMPFKYDAPGRPQAHLSLNPPFDITRFLVRHTNINTFSTEMQDLNGRTQELKKTGR